MVASARLISHCAQGLVAGRTNHSRLYSLRGINNRNEISEHLGSGQIGRIYKRLARQAGLASEIIQRISGHSLRVGGAQDLLMQGASLPQIMVKGGWRKTDTVMRYVEKIRQNVF